MKINFVRCWLLLLLLLQGSFLHAQIFYQVTAISGTQVVGGINVTVSAIGSVPPAIYPCGPSGLGPYSTAVFATAPPHGFKFVFSSPVYAIRSHLVSVNSDDTMGVSINSAAYFVTSANLSAYNSTLCGALSNTVFAYNGLMTSNLPSTNPLPSIQLDVQPGYFIDSAEIYEVDNTGSGVHFDFYFALGCGATPIMSADSPCAGDSLHLGVMVAGSSVSYNWSGPLGFFSADQYPSLANAQSGNAGIYYVTVTADSCTYYDSVLVNVRPQPAFSTSSNSPVCSGDSLHLNINTSQSNGIYQWQGPTGFTATGSHVNRAGMSTSDSGYYTVNANLDGCMGQDSMHVQVKAVPAIPIAASNSPVCAGDSLKLTVSNSQSGISYSWSGPASFSAGTGNAIRLNAQTTYGGVYTVTANLNGCTKSAQTNVVVNPQVGAPTISITATPDTICAGGNVMLSATIGNASSPVYQWKKNNSNTGPNAASFSTGAVTNGDIFSCEVSSSSTCQAIDTAISNAVTMHVLFIAPPVLSISVYPTTYANGDTVTFTGHVPTGSMGLRYSWTKNGVKINGATGISYTTSNVSAGDTICFIAHSSVPCTVPDSSMACWGLSLGIPLIPLKGELRVYPNPVGNELVIESPSDLASMSIYNVLGQSVYHSVPDKSKTIISTNDFVKGVYIVEVVYNDGGKDVVRVVK